jgi:outer membrane protein assembly factor BamB
LPWQDAHGLAADNGTLYVSGDRGLGAYSEATGAELLQWAPKFDPWYDATVWAASNGLVFISTQQGARLVAVDEATGARRWAAPISPDGPIGGVSVTGGVVYVAGKFTSIDGRPRSGLAALDAATGARKAWRPTGRQWSAVAATSAFVYAVDDQSGVIAAFDPSTGARIWQVHVSGGGPIADGVNLRQIPAIAVTPGAVIVGGSFDAVAGHPQVDLVALDPQSGATLPWNPGVAGDTRVRPCSGRPRGRRRRRRLHAPRQLPGKPRPLRLAARAADRNPVAREQKPR